MHCTVDSAFVPVGIQAHCSYIISNQGSCSFHVNLLRDSWQSAASLRDKQHIDGDVQTASLHADDGKAASLHADDGNLMPSTVLNWVNSDALCFSACDKGALV